MGGVGHLASRMATCGATSATNGTGPAALTATPASRTAHSNRTARTRVYRTPSPAATSSPRCIGLNWKAAHATTTRRTSVPQSAMRTSSHDRSSSEPTSHAWARATSLMSAVTSSQVVIASITALTEMPMRMSRNPSIPRRHARKYTSRPVPSPPASAAADRPTELTIAAAVPPETVTRNTAVALAPLVIPRMSGLASGLRATDCVIAPDTPSATPTTSPARARGIRRSMMTNSSTCSPLPRSVAITWDSPMGKSPTPIDRQNSRKAATASSSVTRTIQGRQTNDTPANRRPGATEVFTSAPFGRTPVPFMRS